MFFFKKGFSIDISKLPNLSATPYFLKKLKHLFKIEGKKFDLLKSKSYLSRLEDVVIQIKSMHYLSLLTF